MPEKYRNNNNSNFKSKANIANADRPNDFVNQNNTHISAMTYIICDDETMKDDEYWNFPVHIMTPKSDNDVTHEKHGIQTLDQSLIQMNIHHESCERTKNATATQLNINLTKDNEVSQKIDYDLDSLSCSLSYEHSAYSININGQLTKTHDWMIDSGCTNYIFFNKNEFTEYQSYHINVMIANEVTLWIKGRETIDMKWLLSNGFSNIMNV